MRYLRTISALMLVSTVLTSAAVGAQQKAAVLAGKWTGAVKADIGEMPIEVTIKVEGEKVTGAITTFHGAFTITRAELQKDGRWKLSYSTEEGATGSLTGEVKGDAFAGDWDFTAQAVGKFALTRAKLPQPGGHQ